MTFHNQLTEALPSSISLSNLARTSGINKGQLHRTSKKLGIATDKGLSHAERAEVLSHITSRRATKAANKQCQQVMNLELHTDYLTRIEQKLDSLIVFITGGQL